MIIAGVTLGSTAFEKQLKDGGTCIIIDGQVEIAIAEERIARKKHACGFSTSLPYAIKQLGLRSEDVDVIVYSSCCENEKSVNNIVGYQHAKKLSCNHHYSHALGVYMASPFDQAVVVVLDAGGNTLQDGLPHKWWELKREQHSYFIAQGNKITLIDRDCDLPLAAGIGEVYRAFTHYLGWHSSTFAGKTMALAALGDADRFNGKRIYELEENGHIVSAIQNNPIEPMLMVKSLLTKHNIKDVTHRAKDAEILQCHKDLAAWLQRETERILIEKVNYLVKKTGVRNVCLAGGVAYNCSAIGKIITSSHAEKVFLYTASGDQGQSFGNALYGCIQSLAKPAITKAKALSPFLGGFPDVSLASVKKILQKNDGISIKEYPMGEITTKTAELIARSEIVAWFQGRSEFGPRALGNRSILANPMMLEAKDRLNKIKGRELFMPFAPTILKDKASDFIGTINASPYMTASFKMKPECYGVVPSAIHADKSARVQLLSREFNPLYYDVINYFYKLTKIPMVLNTSFNAAGEPIVETVHDAIKTFSSLDIKYLAIGQLLLQKVESDTHLSIVTYPPTFQVSIDFEQNPLITESEIIYQLSKKASNKKISCRKKFLLFAEFVDWLIIGRKTTTIRFSNKAIDIPANNILPLIPTIDFSSKIKEKSIGYVAISKFIIKKYKDLNESDAKNDGFSTLDELKKVLKEIYKKIKDDEYVTIYTIKLINNVKNIPRN